MHYLDDSTCILLNLLSPLFLFVCLATVVERTRNGCQAPNQVIAGSEFTLYTEAQIMVSVLSEGVIKFHCHSACTGIHIFA